MCDARQYSDQMMCGPCGLAWDVNDQHPPACGKRRAPSPRGVTAAPAVVYEVTDWPMRREIRLRSAVIPETLPTHLAGAMARACEKADAQDNAISAHAMQAAYRVFIDSLG